MNPGHGAAPAAAFAVPAALAERTVLPGDPRYPLLRSTYTTVARPAAVVLVRGPGDIAAALAAARAQGLPVSVRSGGHGLSGRSSNDGGVVVDLSGLDEVRVLDRGTRLVRIGAGARWGRVAAALAPHRLAVSSGDHGNVAAGGLATAGGIGWLARTYGLTVDRVRAAELVLADGTALRADAAHHPDLFWAVRGAGAGVGVVTAFEIEAMELGDIGVAQLVFEADPAGGALTQWASAMAAAPRTLTSAAHILSNGPALALSVTVAAADDDPDRVREALGPLLSGRHRPLQATAQLAAYTALVSGAHEHANTGRQPVVSTNSLLPALTRDAARAVMATAGDRHRPAFVQLRSLGGAINDLPAGATAYAHRTARVMAQGNLFPPHGHDDLNRLWAPVREHGTGSYVNFESGTGPGVFDRVYPGATGARVRELWRRHDPDGVLRPLTVG
ncbi:MULTISPECIES: FAD-binding oxidoreductase [unclassified Streptomyces]|uniref:FAD-binding oxidoreductase n=1 Tax=unclassified Streptomyces TaxID=2593676 RepID=UPI0003650D77|nr:FAD-binding oxidoreductase [Streptomyces sp. BoleA5]MYX35011.1 FAD-binding protein [Streptomyces sp. SID8377]